MILLICEIITLLFLVCLAKGIISAHEKRATHKSSTADESHQSFSRTGYLSRIESLCEALWQEPREKYVLILWWGLDGIRLNEDGTREWISKAKPNPKPVLSPQLISMCDTYYNNMTQVQSCCCDTASRILALERQNTDLRMQAAQM